MNGDDNLQEDLQDRYTTYKHVMGLGGGHLSALKHSGLTERDIANLEGLSARDESLMTPRGQAVRASPRTDVDPMGERDYSGPAEPPAAAEEPYGDWYREQPSINIRPGYMDPEGHVAALLRDPAMRDLISGGDPGLGFGGLPEAPPEPGRELGAPARRLDPSELKSGKTAEEIISDKIAQKESGIQDLLGNRLAQIRRARKGLGEVSDLERGSILAEQGLIAKRTAEEAEVRSDWREDERERIESANTARVLREQAKDAALKNIDEAVDEVVNFKINPNRIFKSTGHSIASALAVALGEFGRGLSGGGPNTALNIINGAIDRDIEAQKTELQGLQFGAKAEGNAYKRLLDKHGSAEKAELLAKEQALSFVNMKIGEIADKYQVPIQASKLGALVAGIEKQRLAKNLRLSDMEFQSRLEQAKVRPAVSPVKLDAADRGFFGDFDEFYKGLGRMRDMYEGTGEFKDTGGLKNFMLRYINSIGFDPMDVTTFSPAWFAKSGATGDFAERVALFSEEGAKLSKSFSSIKEGGKISDMDILFYMRRVPLADDGTAMLEYKMAALEAFAEKAIQVRSGLLSPGGFAKWQKEQAKLIEARGTTTVDDEKTEEIKKLLQEGRT